MKKIIKYILCLSLAITLTICGSFFIKENNNEVYAETQQGIVHYVGNKIIVGLLEINLIITGFLGKVYTCPTFITDLFANPSELIQSSNAVQTLLAWDDFVKTNVIDVDKWRIFYDTVRDKVSATYARAYNLINNAIINGTANETVNKLIDTMMGVKDVVVYMSDSTRISGNYKDTSFVAKLCDLVAKLTQETNSKQYYTEHDTIDDTIKDGTTSKQPIYNDYTKQIYDSYNQTYNDVDTFNYDFNTSVYTYTTSLGNKYQIKNFNNYINVKSIINDVDREYDLYYKLPDGTNSFNLNSENVLGYRTDFNIDNYSSVNNNPFMTNLYHFNGNYKNDLGSYSQLDNWSKQMGDNFTYVNDIWGSALYVNKDQFNLPDISTMNYGTYSIRFMPSFNSNFNMTFSNDNNTIQLGKLIEITQDYEQKTGSQTATTTTSSKYIEDNGRTPTIIMVEAGTGETAQARCNNLDGTPIGYTYYLDSANVYQQACAVYATNNRVVREPNTSTSTTYNYTQWFITENEEESYIGNYGDKIIYDGWNILTIEKMGTYADIYINNNYIDSINISSDNTINISISQDGYTLLDELAVWSYGDSMDYISNHGFHFLPFNNSSGWALPSNLTNANNLILAQSNINVNNFQIGGIRSNQATKGDVYISVNDNGSITSMQQYDGADWVEIKGALYNDTIGKWVDVIGFNINLGDFDNIDLPVIEDTETDYNILSKLNEILDTIKAKFDLLINTITGNNENPIILDNDIVKNNNHNLTINDWFNKLIDYFNNTYDDVNSVNNFENYSQLATSVNGIFDVIDDNNLQILYIAPLIVLILRLVI